MSNGEIGIQNVDNILNTLDNIFKETFAIAQAFSMRSRSEISLCISMLKPAISAVDFLTSLNA
jgi:hypothetical protein